MHYLPLNILIRAGLSAPNMVSKEELIRWKPKFSQWIRRLSPYEVSITKDEHILG